MLRRYDILSGDHWHDVVERESSTGRSVDYDDALAMIRAAFDAGMDRGITERYAPWTEYREQWIRENVGEGK